MSYRLPTPSKLNFILQSLIHDRWMTLAIILGVMIGTASLTGGLIIGDSVRGSLKELTLLRLGYVDSAVVASRFFREELAQQIQQSFPNDGKDKLHVVPMLTLQGSVFKEQKANSQTTGAARVNQVNIFGIKEDYLRFSNVNKNSVSSSKQTKILELKANNILLSRRLADELKVKQGDQLSILLEIPSAIPRDTLLGEREEITQEILVVVSDVLEEESHLSRFSLTPNQRLPYNAYVNLSYLQEQMRLQQVVASRRNPVAKPARVNSLYLLNTQPDDQETTEIYQDLLERKLQQMLTLEDLDLRLVTHQVQGYVSLESNRLLMEDYVIKVLEFVSKSSDLKLKWDVVYVYLINEYANALASDKFSTYSVMGGIELPFSRSPALFDISGKPITQIRTDEIILSDWLAEDLGVKVGDELSCKYHLIGSKGELPEEIVKFKVSQIYKLAGSIFADKGFVPEVEGFTNVETLQELDQPFPMDLNRVTDRDDEYWEEYRAVPKAFISLAQARSLWQSKYGKQTSVQIAMPNGLPAEDFTSQLTAEFLQHVDLQEAGLIVQPLRKMGLLAARGSNDFTGLFLGFSLFLILGALLLVGMLYRLNIEQRAHQVGLMQAIGLSPLQILFLFGGEGLVTVLLGAMLGTMAAILYAEFMIYALTTWWLGAVGTTDLGMHLTFTTLLTGLVISTLLSSIVILSSLRSLNKFSPRELIHGDWRLKELMVTINTILIGETSVLGKYSENDPQMNQVLVSHKPTMLLFRMRYVILLVSLGLIGCSLAGIIPRSEAVAGLAWTVFSFFISGMGLLTAGILISEDLLTLGVLDILTHHGFIGILALAARNSTRQKSRTLVSIALVAVATYLVIAVALGKYNPTKLEPEFKSGNGGFRIVVESTQPILPDWSSPQGRQDLGMTLSEAEQQLLSRTTTYRFLKKAGEDASCLNLYQTSLPTILGVTKSFIERGGFSFAQTLGSNPWEVLNQKLPNREIPVLGDMNTLQFSLHKGPGATIELTNAKATGSNAKVMGMLTGSMFQGVLLMSEENFRKLYPEVAGASYFLVEVSAKDAQGFSTLMESKLADYGLDTQGVAERQREFLSVQNTYLSTFQSLGGLGLLLGTIGVAIVMLRNVLERKREYALMQSLGFMPGYLSSLIIFENGIIVGYGLCIGTLAALISMWPHLSQSGADVPWRDVIMLLGLIFSTGIIAGLYAAKVASQGNIVQTLRN